MPLKHSSRLVMVALLFLLGVESGSAAAPYYQGTYPSSNSNAAPAAPAAAQNSAPPPGDAQPPVVYRRVPVYRRDPAYASSYWGMPTEAALGPWPWNFDIGGGPTVATGSGSGLQGGSNFQFGGGYNFNPNTGFVLEFMNSWLGVSQADVDAHGAIDATAGLLSITLNPIWRFKISGPIGGYLIGGGGYYERETRYDEPVTFFVPTPHGGFYETDFERVHEYDDAGGLNAGAGLTWNWGWGTKFFIEARYHYIFTSGTPTHIIPIVFGFRW